MAGDKRRRTSETGGHPDGARAIDPTHAASVLAQLLQMYTDGRRTDFAVVVGERRFAVHGCVLMCGSAYFRAMLETGVGTGSMREVELPEMSARAFEQILESLYTGVLGSIDDSNVMGLLEASRRLQVGLAEAQCCEWLESRLDVNNALVVWESAHRLGCERVKAKAWPVVGRHLKEMARQEAFLALPQPLLVELLRDDSLAVRSEEAVYEAVIEWVRRDEAGRKEAIGEVLGAVRLELIPAAYLTGAPDRLECVETQRHIQRHLSVIKDGTASDSLVRERNRPVDVGLMVSGGWDGNKTLQAAECYDPLTNQWRALPNQHAQRHGGAAAYIDGLLYAAGGMFHATCNEEHGQQYTLSKKHCEAECYDPSSGDWRDLPHMSIARYGCAAAGLDGLLYVVGGEDHNRDGPDNVLASAECYDPSKRKWLALPSMSIGRFGGAAASVDGLLYVVGGQDDTDLPEAPSLADAECYDPSTREWRELPDMIFERTGCAAAGVDGLLYVVGGCDSDNNVLSSVECYDPSTGQWRELPEMSVARCWCAAASFDDILYVVGGEGADDSILASAECFDPSLGQWRALPDMSVARRCFQLAALQ